MLPVLINFLSMDVPFTHADKKIGNLSFSSASAVGLTSVAPQWTIPSFPLVTVRKKSEKTTLVLLTQARLVDDPHSILYTSSV